MSVTFASNGDLVLNERNLEACNMLEYYAVTVIQYCKETSNRDLKVYDLKGTAVSHMANDLKEFAKGYIDRDGKKKNYDNYASASMLRNITNALEMFGESYNSGSCKSAAKAMKEKYSNAFMFEDIVSAFTKSLLDKQFRVSMCRSVSSSSIYLDIDYKRVGSIRISDHVSKDYKGYQVIFGKKRCAESGSNGIYSICESTMSHDLDAVKGYIIKNLEYERVLKGRELYKSDLGNYKNEYKTSNPNYRSLDLSSVTA